MGMGILRMPGIRIATPVCGLVRNDSIFDRICTDWGATRHQTSMSLRGAWPKAMRRGNPYSSMRSIVSAPRPTIITKINDYLSANKERLPVGGAVSVIVFPVPCFSGILPPRSPWRRPGSHPVPMHGHRQWCCRRGSRPHPSGHRDAVRR